MADYRLIANDIVIRTSDNAHIPSDPANRDRLTYEKWLANGNVPDPFIPPPPPTPKVLSQDLMAQFTVTDYKLIKDAIAVNDSFGLLWSSMQAQKDPMLITNARFITGWNALVSILGQSRMNVIATALNLHSLVV